MLGVTLLLTGARCDSKIRQSQYGGKLRQKLEDSRTNPVVAILELDNRCGNECPDSVDIRSAIPRQLADLSQKSIARHQLSQYTPWNNQKSTVRYTLTLMMYDIASYT
jgi:hypothetical protein